MRPCLLRDLVPPTWTLYPLGGESHMIDMSNVPPPSPWVRSSEDLATRVTPWRACRYAHNRRLVQDLDDCCLVQPEHCILPFFQDFMLNHMNTSQEKAHSLG